MRQPKTHTLKCWAQYFQAVKWGVKTFEIRLNDRDFRTGDVLILKEFIPIGEMSGGGKFTGGELTRKISYMTDWEQKDNYVVLGLSDQGEVLNQERYDFARKIVSDLNIWIDSKDLINSVIDRAIRLEREVERLSDQGKSTRLREALEIICNDGGDSAMKLKTIARHAISSHREDGNDEWIPADQAPKEGSYLVTDGNSVGFGIWVVGSYESSWYAADAAPFLSESISYYREIPAPPIPGITEER